MSAAVEEVLMNPSLREVDTHVTVLTEDMGLNQMGKLTNMYYMYILLQYI